MKVSQRWVWLAVGLTIALIMAAGCKREIVADVTEAPVVQETAVPDEGIVATAYVEATRAAEAEAEAQAEEATAVPSTAVPTSVPPTAVPTVEAVAATAIPTVAPTNTPVPEAAVVSPTTAPGDGSSAVAATIHVVQRGENLFRIALRYGTTVQALASANGIANPGLLYVGQRLTIPGSSGQPTPAPSGGTTHVVQRGENLFRIALRYNMSYLTLAQYNGISNPAQIYVGQVLRIPPR